MKERWNKDIDEEFDALKEYKKEIGERVNGDCRCIISYQRVRRNKNGNYTGHVTEYERKHNPIGIMIRNQDVEGCKQSLDNLSDVIKKIDSVINFEINNKCVVEELPF